MGVPYPGSSPPSPEIGPAAGCGTRKRAESVVCVGVRMQCRGSCSGLAGDCALSLTCCCFERLGIYDLRFAVFALGLSGSCSVAAGLVYRVDGGRTTEMVMQCVECTIPPSSLPLNYATGNGGRETVRPFWDCGTARPEAIDTPLKDIPIDRGSLSRWDLRSAFQSR